MDGSTGRLDGNLGAPAETSATSASQHTLAAPISCIGVGVHSGQRVAVTLRSAPVGTGVRFVRTDLGVTIPATPEAVVDTRLNTTLAANGASVSTVEHLMAALSAARIDNATVEVGGPELPILDGSASDWVFLIGCVGRVAQAAPRRVLTVLRTVRVTDGQAYAELSPTSRAGAFELSMTIAFAAPVIGTQRLEATLTPGAFRSALAWARTFAMADEIEVLRQAGLARGGNLTNAVVVDGARVLNPGGLRSPDEFVRHKMLDAVGDLALCGAAIEGRFTGVRSGHALNNRLLRAWLANATAFADSAKGLRAAA